MALDATSNNNSDINDLKVFSPEDSPVAKEENADNLFSAEAFKLSIAGQNKNAEKFENMLLAQAPDSAPNDEFTELRKERLAELRIEAQENTKAGKGNTWAHGELLYSISSLEVATGDIKNGMKDLKASIDILKKTTDLPEDKVTAQRTLTDMMNGYAELLVQPKPNQSKQDVLNERREADTVFSEIIDRAKNENRQPFEIADVMRNKSDNLVGIATSNDVKTPAGKAAYRAQMQTAIDTLSEAAGLVENENNIRYIAPKALLYGSLGRAEMFRADAAGDKDAQNAEKHLKEAIDLWHQFGDNVHKIIDPTQIQQAVASKDAMLKVMLASYFSLLRSQQRENSPQAQEALREFRSLSQSSQ
jgi:hypothetical protein